VSQPLWKFVHNFGDASPLDHGGLFLYEDSTGVYGYEAERIEPNEDEDGTVEIRRVCLDRCKEVRDGDRLYLVPFTYEASWPHPLASYVEWFAPHLASIAEYVDSTEEELRAGLCSENGIERLEAYRAIYDHEGWANGDEYPRTLTRAEAKKRYRKELKK
jgi:hypothetical protein